MTRKLIYPIVVVVFAAACGGDGETGKRAGQQQYETVQEGSAAGVTAALNGPGETLPPITNTNADTTSAFTLDPNGVPMNPQQQAPPTMAGTIPASAGASPAYNPTPSQPPMTRAPQREASYSSPAPQRQVYTPPPMTSSSQPRPSQPPRPVERETAPVEEPVAGPAPTDSAQATPPATNTAPLQPSRLQPQEPPQQEAPAVEPEDSEEQAEEPPPPPPLR
ncbi:MAG TPA: hypothetical protein VE010_15705 [Thermoanaerobaculia bacterium]|nr:hypothetical protein [Thermoanaerobaculia bacterium]